MWQDVVLCSPTAFQCVSSAREVVGKRYKKSCCIWKSSSFKMEAALSVCVCAGVIAPCCLSFPAFRRREAHVFMPPLRLGQLLCKTRPLLFAPHSGGGEKNTSAIPHRPRPLTQKKTSNQSDNRPRAPDKGKVASRSQLCEREQTRAFFLSPI